MTVLSSEKTSQGAKRIRNIQAFYAKEKALVTSPFITQHLELNRTLLDRVFKRLKISHRSLQVLDVGCGTGQLAAYFTDAKKYVGMDLNKRDHFIDLLDLQHAFLQADAHRIPLQNGSMDLVICLDSFEHFPDPATAVREITRVLRPGGTVFLSIPTYANVAGLVKKWCEKYGRYQKDTWAPFDFWKPQELEHFITPGRIKKLFADAGFHRTSVLGYDQEVVVGLFPWIWHRRMPHALEVLIKGFFAVISKFIVNVCPPASLHTFWKINR